jgi:hypothetical protein
LQEGGTGILNKREGTCGIRGTDILKDVRTDELCGFGSPHKDELTIRVRGQAAIRIRIKEWGFATIRMRMIRIRGLAGISKG